MADKYVGYVRVSTKQQADSGLGEAAQRNTINKFVESRGGELVEIVSEVESGRSNSRPALARALAKVKAIDGILVIARLDRLSRNVAFVATLMDQRVRFRACDIPEANEFTVNVMASMAQYEASLISARTKQALEAAKRAGKKLGNPRLAESRVKALESRKRRRQIEEADAVAFLRKLHAVGRAPTARAATVMLNSSGIAPVRGGRWHLSTVWRMMKQHGLVAKPRKESHAEVRA